MTRQEVILPCSSMVLNINNEIKMAQESISDFMEMAKEYAKAEKELEVQNWVYIGIERIDTKGTRVRIFSYNLPREVYERRDWAVRWREAKLRCQFPKDNVQCYFSFYDKRLGNDPKLTADLRTIASAKAQVSKVQRKIDEYVKYHRANGLFFDESTDMDLLRVREKLSIKQRNVQKCEERLKCKIKQIQEKKK